MSERTVSRLLQIANHLGSDAQKIVEANHMTQAIALRLSQLPRSLQVEAASLLATGAVQSVEEYLRQRREKIRTESSAMPDTPLPADSRTEAEEEQARVEALNKLVREFARFVERILDQMEIYRGLAYSFAEMSTSQISTVLNSVAAVDKAISSFSADVKAIQTANENDKDVDESEDSD